LNHNSYESIGTVSLDEGHQEFSISFPAEISKMNGTLEKFYNISFVPDSVNNK
jgi:hypothetical protein